MHYESELKKQMTAFIRKFAKIWSYILFCYIKNIADTAYPCWIHFLGQIASTFFYFPLFDLAEVSGTAVCREQFLILAGYLTSVICKYLSVLGIFLDTMIQLLRFCLCFYHLTFTGFMSQRSKLESSCWTNTITWTF